MTANTFKSIRTVAVPVSDQDRTQAALARLGFSVAMDAELRPGFRWIEMAPADGEPSIALVLTGPELPTGVDTGIRLTTDDARAAHAAIEGVGFTAGELLDWPGVPLMFSFVDLDGNRFYVSETD
ncbi:MAG TPA: glyoxalase [Acidimicrobiia bacterium]|jgi:hypothetical protein|nr:glyoxalase [Acidimicrobiia bacterium]